MVPAEPTERALTRAGLLAWLLVSLPTLRSATHSPRFPYWTLAAVLGAAALVHATRHLRAGLRLRAALLVQIASVTTMVGLLCNGYEGVLLALVAAQIGAALGSREGIAWITGATIAAGLAIGLHWTPGSALLLVPPYLGLQLFAFVTLRLLAREAQAREALARSLERALFLQDRLDQRARLDERLRIAQDLHDALGHHLTAMSLNLEAAAHQSEGPARDTVRTAQSLARTVLADVKQIVRSIKDEEDVDLEAELRRLASDVPAPRVHLVLPEGLGAAVGKVRARTLLRCVQEIVTNAIRHASARNLWIDLALEDGGCRLSARDDGRGAHGLEPGHGLRGMRERIEKLGGTLAVETGSGAGFALRARLPDPGAAS
jgi:signal transduction histidine kinase